MGRDNRENSERSEKTKRENDASKEPLSLLIITDQPRDESEESEVVAQVVGPSREKRSDSRATVRI